MTGRRGDGEKHGPAGPEAPRGEGAGPKGRGERPGGGEGARHRGGERAEGRREGGTGGREAGAGRRGQPERERRPERPPSIAPALRVAPEQEVLYGRNAVMEALRAGKRVRRLLVSPEAMREEYVRDAVGMARRLGIVAEQVSRAQLDAVAAEHQGLVAVVSAFEYAGWGDLLERLKGAEAAPAVLLLDTLQDPQNLGTLLRTSEAVGLDAVVLPKKRSVHITPGVVRASAGAVEHMAVARVPNLVRAVEDLKEIGFWIAGIDMEGDRFHWELDMTGPTALVLGGEDRGIGPLLKEKCDFLIRLPMRGKVNSLNAAAAGSVVLYEMVRQRME